MSVGPFRPGLSLWAVIKQAKASAGAHMEGGCPPGCQPSLVPGLGACEVVQAAWDNLETTKASGHGRNRPGHGTERLISMRNQATTGRICSICAQTFFEGGRSNRCDPCLRAAARARYHRRKAADPEKVNAESRRSNKARTARLRQQGGEVWQRELRKTAERVRRHHLLARGDDSDPIVAWQAVIRSDPCAYCGDPHADTFDHIVALERGGEDDWTNLTAACRRCNASKRTRPLLLMLLGEYE